MVATAKRGVDAMLTGLVTGSGAFWKELGRALTRRGRTMARDLFFPIEFVVRKGGGAPVKHQGYLRHLGRHRAVLVTRDSRPGRGDLVSLAIGNVPLYPDPETTVPGIVTDAKPLTRHGSRWLCVTVGFQPLDACRSDQLSDFLDVVGCGFGATRH
jgi:hypothetical protein